MMENKSWVEEVETNHDNIGKQNISLGRFQPLQDKKKEEVGEEEHEEEEMDFNKVYWYNGDETYVHAGAEP